MRRLIQVLWVNYLRQIVIIILTAIAAITLFYSYQQYRIIRHDADWAFQESVKLKTERIEIKSTEDDGVKDDVSLAPTSDSVQPIDPTGEPKNSPQGSGNEIIDTIYEVAKEKNFENPELLVRIARAESSLNPCVKNPNSSAIGIFQILDMHNLSKEERCNPRIATAWAIDHFAGGRPWNSSRSKWENM